MIKDLINRMTGTVSFKSCTPLTEMSLAEVKRTGVIEPSSLIIGTSSLNNCPIPFQDFIGTFELDEAGYLISELNLSYFELDEAFAYFEEYESMEAEDELLPRLHQTLLTSSLSNYEVVHFEVHHNLPVPIQLERVKIDFNESTYDLPILDQVQQEVNLKLQ